MYASYDEYTVLMHVIQETQTKEVVLMHAFHLNVLLVRRPWDQ